MPISVQCDECFESFRIRDDLEGKAIKCKACGAAIRVGGAKKESPVKKNRTPDPDEELDDDAIQSRQSPRRRGKASRRSEFSIASIPKLLYDTPWVFLVIAMSIGLAIAPLIPERIVLLPNTMDIVILRGFFIGLGYTLIGLIWYSMAVGLPKESPKSFGERFAENLKKRLFAAVMGGLILGTVVIPNVIGQIACGAVLLAVVIWHSRDLKPNEWRPVCMALVGIAYLIPAFLAAFKGGAK